MKKVKFASLVVIILIMITGLGFTGCADLAKTIQQVSDSYAGRGSSSSSGSSSKSGSSSGSSSTSGSSSSSVSNKSDIDLNETKTYYFNNYSSYDVYLYDITGRLTIPKGHTASGRFNRTVPIDNVHYGPADKVYYSFSGDTVSFRNK